MTNIGTLARRGRLLEIEYLLEWMNLKETPRLFEMLKGHSCEMMFHACKYNHLKTACFIYDSFTPGRIEFLNFTEYFDAWDIAALFSLGSPRSISFFVMLFDVRLSDIKLDHNQLVNYLCESGNSDSTEWFILHYKLELDEKNRVNLGYLRAREDSAKNEMMEEE